MVVWGGAVTMKVWRCLRAGLSWRQSSDIARGWSGGLETMGLLWALRFEAGPSGRMLLFVYLRRVSEKRGELEKDQGFDSELFDWHVS